MIIRKLVAVAEIPRRRRRGRASLLRSGMGVIHVTVTIWDTNTDAIATRREITGWTTPEGDASPEPIYSDPVPLERLTAAIWTRPRWNATMRADPASYGANNFRAGERILDVIDARPTLGEFDRLGAMWAGVPDLDRRNDDVHMGEDQRGIVRSGHASRSGVDGQRVG
jgi:hypothetical protein